MLLLFLVPLSISSVQPAHSGQAAADSSALAYPVLPAAPGERCAVCGMALTADDVALVVKGRRVPVHRSELAEFRRNPELYFSQYQPRSALFQEDFGDRGGAPRGSLAFGWLYFGLYILIALLSAGLSGYRAVTVGLKPIPHFFIGLLFSIPGLIFVLLRTGPRVGRQIPPGLAKVPTTSEPVPCPACGNLTHPSATHCASCNVTLRPSVPSEVSRIS